jgi:hypothetical protein
MRVNVNNLFVLIFRFQVKYEEMDDIIVAGRKIIQRTKEINSLLHVTLIHCYLYIARFTFFLGGEIIKKTN